MQLVLAIEPDLRQATIVKRIVREKVLADVAVVDSRDAALEAMRTTMPDVLLLSALMSPRDEDELIAHLRTLEHADHLQTHTIPQLASALGPGEGRASGGLLSAFLRKKKKEPESAPSGCDPDIFAEEIRSYLLRAAEKKRERLDGQTRPAPEDQTWRTAPPPRTVASIAEPDRAEEDETSSSSSWASPFEWKPSSSTPSSPIASLESPISVPESPIAYPESPIAQPESHIAYPESHIARPESLIAHPEPHMARPESHTAHPESRITPPEELTLMAHLRPPSGVTTLKALRESLAAESRPVAAAEPAPDQEITPFQIAAAIPDPKPILEAAPVEYREPARIPEPIQEATPIQEWVAVQESTPIPESAPIPKSAPIAEPAPIRDAGLRMKDSGLGIRDQRSPVRDSRLGALASWARAERTGRGAAEKTDDLYGVLMGLAVPPAVVAVGYGRGCRIRRVRVPVAPEPLPETNGPIILSKRALAEQREQRT